MENSNENPPRLLTKLNHWFRKAIGLRPLGPVYPLLPPPYTPVGPVGPVGPLPPAYTPPDAPIPFNRRPPSYPLPMLLQRPPPQVDWAARRIMYLQLQRVAVNYEDNKDDRSPSLKRRRFN